MEVAAEENTKSSIYDRFSNEMLSRCQKSLDKSSQENPLAANMLAESLVQTANEVKNQFGQEKANEFMSSVISVTDGGVNENSLTAAVGGFFQNLSQEVKGTQEGVNKMAAMKEFLNKGLDQIFQDDEIVNEDFSSGAAVGLSYALNRYFDKPAAVDEENQNGEALGFNADFERVNMGVRNNSRNVDPETGEVWLNVRSASRITASELSTSETAGKVADFLRNEIGNENAASYMESLGEGSHFMEAIGTAVGIVAEEDGQEAARNFVSFLNSNVKSAVENTEDGMKFSGWRLGRDYASDNIEQISGSKTNELWIADGFMEDRLEKNKHQGLYTNWMDNNSGVGSGLTLDINQLYANYQSSAKASPAPTNQPTGNLVDTTV
ncbi:hypothetical protein C4J81_18380 [Deltaproteobacteria bacterium Smac51]|nr:hypothetical protein C4J81_18380 [Deltaproteobacteria bacterium Smac51]